MKHIMIDIETMGTKPGAIILSVAAVEFDLSTGKTGLVFHQTIDPESSQKAGMKLDFDTVVWWIKQGKEAQKVIVENTGNKLEKVLTKLADWIKDYCDENVYVWGNSARFDLGLLQAAYEVFEMDIPWNHYNELDVRTIASFGREIKDNMAFEGVKHNPLDDCYHQIKYCSEIYKQKIKA